MDEHKDYENLKKTLIESYDTTCQLLGGTNVFYYINWILAVNTGALLWFVGILDKFVINNQLVSKWWAIGTILFLLVSEIPLYRVYISLFKLNLQLKMAKVECLEAKFPDKININKPCDSLKKLLPSVIITSVAEIFFLIGVISMIGYIITYFIRYK